ncbi:MAG: LLM class flavin-dependent oxidoreductase [Alphaproteobacteria bacterium]|nr:LLM class flavin-dependent oxidoreductase [Alphaproteobacteria bacterium]
MAVAAEAAGLSSVWFAENPFHRGVLATAGACATSTARVRIGVGVVNPFSRHPALIAMEFAALAELAPGRIVLGLGSGVGASVKRMGFPHDRPLTALREAVGIVRAMLHGDSVTHRDGVFSVKRAQLAFQAKPVPIYMAGGGQRAVRACGNIGDGLVVSNLTPVRSTARLAETLRLAAGRYNRQVPEVVQYVPCVVRPDGAAARAAVKHVIGEMLTSFWPTEGPWPAFREALVEDSGIPRSHFAAVLAWLRRGEDPDHLLDDQFVGAFAIAGTAEECLKQAAAYGAAGAAELALTFAGMQPAEDIAYLGKALQENMA